MTLAGHLEPVAAAAAATDARAAVVVVAETADETATLCRGFTDRTMTAAVTDRTRFEIGSVTKTFTALLLAEMAARGELRLDDLVSSRVPPGAAPRGAYGGRCTLEQLATHTSGLPSLPSALIRSALPSWFANPYARFAPDRVWPALAGTRIRRPPGARVRYSNFGAGLLGRLLTEEAATDYGTLLRARVLDPLGLADTSPDPGLPQATGHAHGRPRPPWLIPALPGAGALRSSARDLLHYLRALTDPDGCAPSGSTLRAALREVVQPRERAPGGPELCLAWTRRALPTHVVFFHSGATRGFTTFTGFSLDPAVRVVALTNSGPTLRNRFVQASYLLLRALARHAPTARAEGS
ncbi:serine hydrolase domain-containing protein [Streptomyces sp. 6N223]|uniref:serine hydrolase domain-containing protein n=1 Tax=Streptomyces sp. 6N223 TaxID=3457412 RepID=UPI003FD242AB